MSDFGQMNGLSFGEMEALAAPLQRGEATCTTEALRPRIAEGIAKHARGELVNFEVTLQVFPDPQGGMQPVIFVLVDVIGEVLGTRMVNIAGPFQATLRTWSDEMVETVCADLMANTFHQRREQSAAMTQQMRDTLATGQPARMGGPVGDRS